MASAKIVFDTRRKKELETYPIVIRIYHQSNFLSISTGYSCTIDQWDAGNLRVKKSKDFKEWSKANTKIQQTLSNATTFIEKNKHRLYSLSCSQLRQEIIEFDPNEKEKIVEHITLKEAVELYLKYIMNEGVPEHKIRVRNEKYVKEIVRVLNFLQTVISPELSFLNITDNHAGQYYKAIRNLKGRYGDHLTPPTYNFYIVCVRQFFDYIISKGYKNTNYFKGIELRKVKTEPKMVYLEEFQELLDKIENGDHIRIYEYETKKGHKRKEKKNMYTPWLKHGMMLALLGGGRRREEIAMLRWSCVMPSNGKLTGGILSYRNFKSERLKNIRFEDEQLPVDIPITKQLADLLMKMGWKEKGSSDEYILAPETVNREYVMAAFTKGFKHYYGQIANPRPGISFKSLRKTYITYVRYVLSGRAKEITGHTKEKIIDDHYEDKKLQRESLVKKLKF